VRPWNKNQGRSDGGIWVYIRLYPPKSVQVNFLWGKNDVRTDTEQFYTPQNNFYTPKTNFWLRPCIKNTRKLNTCLIFVKFLVDEFVFSLFLERDDDESDEDVDEEERKDDEVDDVEDGHVQSVAWLWAAILSRRVDGMFQHAVRYHITDTMRFSFD